MRLLIGLLTATCLVGVAHAKGGSHTISAHTTKNGTYVAPSHATNPNSSRSDNWSSKGNVNPYTGKAGTKDPSAPKAPTTGRH